MAGGAVSIALIGIFAHEWLVSPEAQLAFKSGLIFVELLLLWQIIQL